ncbi:HMG box-containing protein C28F2.11-like isoform X1 [Mugil cephalus]|uniref:HMG box-containing protein C28F2.11-like isoform X1 n=2 Tax=Mugil cephalus TaxID=48193 RepID=UPI001FB57D72|nr:HMG box-containing protein C28F2.11-like isoform X1 [Mugil cephalus]
MVSYIIVFPSVSDFTPGRKNTHRDPARNNKDVTQFRETTKKTISECDPADPEKMNDVLPESDKKADEDEESMTSPANAPPPVSSENPPSKDAEHKEDTNSDQDAGETEEKNNENPQSPDQDMKQQQSEPKTGGEKSADRPPVPEKPFRDSTISKKYVAQPREPTEKTVSECDPADPEKMNDVLPGALNDDKSDKKPDDDKESMTSSANTPPAVSSENSPSQDGEHKEDVNSDQGKESSGLDEGTSPEQKGAEA